MTSLRRRIGRVAHAQVDHVVAGPPLLKLQRVDAGEQIGGQPLDAFGDFDLKRLAVVGRFVVCEKTDHSWQAAGGGALAGVD